MGAGLIVFDQPVFRDLAHLLQGFEDMEVQHFFAETAVESFYQGVLGWFAGLNELQLDSVICCPFCHGDGYEFGSVVHPHLPGVPPARRKSVQSALDAGCRQVQIDLIGQSLPVAVIDHIEGPELAPVPQAVRHEIDGPREVQLFWNAEGSRVAIGHSPFPFPPVIQFQLAVHPVNPLVVEGMPFTPQHLEQLSEAVARETLNQVDQAIDHIPIPVRIRLVLGNRPRKSNHPASPTFTGPRINHQFLDQLTTCRRVQSFFSSTSFSSM